MKVFLSYSSRDRAFVHRLANDLERVPYEVWRDERRLTVGTELTMIDGSIAVSDCLIVVVSSNSAESDWVHREVETARANDVRILPVILEDAPRWSSTYLQGLSHADFRSIRSYRRSLQRLVAAISGTDYDGRFLSARQAVAQVRTKFAPEGALFGISQQGVAQVYHRANERAWEWADATDGSSRFWIVEFFNPGTETIEPFACVDGRSQRLPGSRLYKPGELLGPGSVIVYSCGLNPEAQERADPAVDFPSEDGWTNVSERLVRFRPIALNDNVIDSTEAIWVAVDAAYATGRIDPLADTFVLARLECDKKNDQLPTWRVSFFDPSRSDGILSIGVDPASGRIRDFGISPETLNANFMKITIDESGDYVVDISRQFQAIDARDWDIPEQNAYQQTGLTATEALMMAARFASAADQRPWQLAFLSNTGVTRSVSAPNISSAAAALMKRDGQAGQWVVDLLSPSFETIIEDGRRGASYAWRQILCTRQGGAVEVTPSERLALTHPLVGVAPSDATAAYARAFRLAVSTVNVDFRRLSVAMDRPRGEILWKFRFYDASDIVARVQVSADGRRTEAVS